jgi:hypothetical protein
MGQRQLLLRTCRVQQPAAAEPANNQQKKAKQPKQPKQQNKQQQAQNTSSAEEIRALRIEKVRLRPAGKHQASRILTVLLQTWYLRRGPKLCAPPGGPAHSGV